MKKIIILLFIVSNVISLVACTASHKPVPAVPVAFGAPPASPKPTFAVDGVVQDGEYAVTNAIDPFKVSVAKTKDAVKFAVSARTRGWVAVGLGSKRMNGAKMFMGMVQDGKAVFSEQLGRGHSHREVAADALLASASAVKEAGGVTTMEFTVPLAQLPEAAGKTVDAILAASPSDSLTDVHAVYQQASLKLE